MFQKESFVTTLNPSDQILVWSVGAEDFYSEGSVLLYAYELQ